MRNEIRESIVASREWPLRRRVIMHAIFHQLVTIEEVLNPDRPMVELYKTYSFDVLTGFLQGKNLAACLNDVEVADEVFITLFDAMQQSIDEDTRDIPLDNNDDEDDTNYDESFAARTYITLAPIIIKIHLPSVPDEEINDIFDDIFFDEKEKVCNSRKLLDLAFAMGGLAYKDIERIVRIFEEVNQKEEDYNIDDEYDEEDEDFLSESRLNFYPNRPLYHLTNHRLEFKNLKRIATCDGFYAPGHGCIVPSFNPRPPQYYFAPANPSTYYMNHIRKMFKVVDQRSRGEEDDLQAIEYSFKSWMRIAIGRFYEGYPNEALYIISAVITEFVKGMHLGVMSRALKRVKDFQNNLKQYLKDSLSMAIYFMDYVSDEIYDKVCQRLNLLVKGPKEDKLTRLLVNLSPFEDYQNKRRKVNDPEVSEEIQKVIDTLGQREDEPIITLEEPRYSIIDREEIDEILDRIYLEEGPYEPPTGTICSSVDGRAPYWIEPKDPSTYYIQRLKNNFKILEEHYQGDEDELKALIFSLQSWIDFALKNFSESNPVRALYVISAELTEFTKGLSQGVMYKALESNPDVMINVHMILKDVLSLTLYFMEYVPDEAYKKVSNRLRRFIQEFKPELNAHGLVDFKPFDDYVNERSKVVSESL